MPRSFGSGRVRVWGLGKEQEVQGLQETEGFLGFRVHLEITVLLGRAGLGASKFCIRQGPHLLTVAARDKGDAMKVLFRFRL